MIKKLILNVLSIVLFTSGIVQAQHKTYVATHEVHVETESKKNYTAKLSYTFAVDKKGVIWSICHKYTLVETIEGKHQTKHQSCVLDVPYDCFAFFIHQFFRASEPFIKPHFFKPTQFFANWDEDTSSAATKALASKHLTLEDAQKAFEYLGFKGFFVEEKRD